MWPPPMGLWPKEEMKPPTHQAWETKGSRKLLAPLKHISVILNSRMVSPEKDITNATQDKRRCGVGLEVDSKKETRC